jgi:hypothetical protein
MSSQRVELKKEQWDLLALILKECDQPDLSESERVDAKIIAGIIDLERGTYGHKCDHEYGKIIQSVCVASATRYDPAEYRSTAECLICGDEVDPEDCTNIVER